MEIIITLVFWILLWPGVKDYIIDPLDKAQMVLDHSLPMTLLILDYVLLNSIPFVMRHLPAQIFVMLVYLVINIGYSIYQGYPVYPPLDWTDWRGILLGVLLAVFFAVMSYLMQRFTLWKLRLF